MSMIIKKLELQGFKSFADRTKIAFHPGITAIVGPNGTGKSNLVDALLWVQGGHRIKSVRGDRTEDVIFNGNAKKPPLSMADVVLSLGGDEEELVVSHRVFRSGESEYRLNGKTARLKDIQDELWRHSIGEAEYFVIEQGAIGNFVTSKPIEKRALIEEAAGTAYYKDKKKQAQSKLESTEINLTRLEDIIVEVEKAKNSLQRQAQAANRYRRLRERIRELTSCHYLKKSARLQEALDEAAALFAQGQSREQDVVSQVKAREREIAGRRHELWELEKSVKENQEKLFGLRSHITRLESEIDRESKRVEFLEEKKKRSEADRGEILGDLLVLTKELEEVRERLSGLTADFDASRARTDEAAGALEAARDAKAHDETSLESLRESYIDALQALTEARNETIRADKEIELLARHEEKLTGQIDAESRLLEETKARSTALDAELGNHKALRETAAGKVDSLRREHAGLVEEIAGLQSRVAALTSKRDEAVHHLQALRRVEEKERGEILTDEIPGSLGLLADLLRTSAENAPMFDVFWREEARARVVPAEDLIGGIPEGLRGSYLLIPSKARPPIPADVLAMPHVLGLLKGRVDAEERIKDRLAGLEDAVIVADIAQAVRIWADHPELNFLTPAGDVLLASGLLRLGVKAEGAMTLATEIRALAETAAVYEAELAPLSARLATAESERAAAERDLERETGAFLREDRAVQDMEKESAFGRAEAARIEATRGVLTKELAILRADKASLGESLASAGGRVAAGEAAVVSFKERTEAEERRLAEGGEHAAGAERRFLEAKAALDLLQEKMNGLRGQMQATSKRKEAAEAKINQLEDDIRRGDEDKERLAAEIGRLRETVKSVGAEQAASASSLEAGETRLQTVRAELETAEASLEAVRREEEAAKDDRVKHEIRKAEVERDLVNLDEMCWQELKKTLAELRSEAAAAATAPEAEAAQAPEEEDEEAVEAEEETAEAQAEAAPAPAESAAAPSEKVEPGAAAEAPKPRRTMKKWRPVAAMSAEEVEQELEESRENLNRFKAVNLMAEEEFAEQKKRFEFLTGQRQDLRDSIASTEEAIRKIDAESKVQFLKALEEVNKNFQELFTSLFKGGNAEVKLLEPENPLESGVEIAAQPPGKRVQNLSLLSGGEKSLTSLAFLFALFRYRPSPFCFLDEVDAALDDVNLARFLNLLKTIKHQTQFILITHNYKTMEVADYIYGTTMSEPNMTKLLSVKLEKKTGVEVSEDLT